MENIKIYAFADEASPVIDEQIAAMKRNRLDGIEIRNADGVNVSELTAQKAKEIAKKLYDNGLSVWSVGSPIGKINIATDDFEKHFDKFKHTVEIADILGADNIRIFSFFIPWGENPDNYKNAVIDRLGQMLEVVKGSKIELCHENEKGIFGDIASRCLELHTALPDLKGIFDPANFIQCKQDTLQAWDMLAPYIKYMHIKDALADGNVVPAGKGDGKLKQIVADFISKGGNSFTIEPHLTVFDGLKELEREGEQSGIGLYRYPDSNTAFDAACSAFREVLEK